MNPPASILRNDARCAPQPILLAQIVNKRAHIGSGRTRHLERGPRLRARFEGDHYQFIDSDRAWEPVNLLAAPRLAVQALAPDLHRRDHRRDLLDRSEERRRGRGHRSEIQVLGRRASKALRPRRPVWMW